MQLTGVTFAIPVVEAGVDKSNVWLSLDFPVCKPEMEGRGSRDESDENENGPVVAVQTRYF